MYTGVHNYTPKIIREGLMKAAAEETNKYFKTQVLL